MTTTYLMTCGCIVAADDRAESLRPGSHWECPNHPDGRMVEAYKKCENCGKPLVLKITQVRTQYCPSCAEIRRTESMARAYCRQSLGDVVTPRPPVTGPTPADTWDCKYRQECLAACTGAPLVLPCFGCDRYAPLPIAELIEHEQGGKPMGLVSGHGGDGPLPVALPPQKVWA